MPASIDNQTASHLLRRLPHPERTLDPARNVGRVAPMIRMPRSTSDSASRLIPSRVQRRVFSPAATLELVRRFAVLPNRWTRIIVRGFDLFGALFGLVVALPLMAALALIVRLTTHGPAFFVHWRVGRRGRLFPCLKFRSMWPDAEERLEHLLAEDETLRAEWDETQKLRDDPRITPVGQFLRKTNLDEFPQLFNVLIGQMSLVGPRPVTPGELERYGDDVTDVLSVKPGLTGLWQISGRSDVSYQERVALDLEYVRTRSLGSDIVICAKTAIAMAHPSSDGAY